MVIDRGMLTERDFIRLISYLARVNHTPNTQYSLNSADTSRPTFNRCGLVNSLVDNGHRRVVGEIVSEYRIEIRITNTNIAAQLT